MAADARIAVGLPGHPKTKKLIKRLGQSAAWNLVCLILWAAANRSDGNLSGMTDEDIELAADWAGDEGAFVAALKSVRFLDEEEGDLVLHDWHEHNPWAAGAEMRSAKAKWNAAKRHHGPAEADRIVPEYAAIRNASSNKDSNASSKQAAEVQQASCIAPSPSPSPSPSPLIPSDAYASGSASPPPTADPPVPAPPEKPALTPVEIIFGYGLPLLTNAGTPEKQARSFLGGLRKHAGDEAVVNALRDCLKAKPLQPLEWLAAALPPDAVEGKKQPESFREKDARLAAERVAEFAPALARKTTPLNPANVFDIEAKEVTNVIAIQGC